jgi:hypothetical protein
MKQDLRYECALSAALVILELLEKSPNEPKHQRLAHTVFSILHAMDRYEEEKGALRAGFSVN